MTEEAATPHVSHPVAEDADTAARPRIALDGRRPRWLDESVEALQVVAGHVDVFAVGVAGQVDAAAGGVGATRARHHLLRAEAGEVLFGFPTIEADADGAPGAGIGASRAEEVRIVAVGGLGAEAIALGHGEVGAEAVSRWIGRLAGVIAGPYPSWEIAEAGTGATDLARGERLRGPGRGIVWVGVRRGAGRPMDVGPPCEADGPWLPLTAGLWIAAGGDGCTLVADGEAPRGAALAAATGQFQAQALACIRHRLVAEAGQQAERLTRRDAQTAARATGLFERLAAVVPGARARMGAIPTEVDAPILAACRLVAEAHHVVLARPPTTSSDASDLAAVADIARVSRLRVRQVLLRHDWWRRDGGALIGWLGEARRPVALLPKARRGYVMVDPSTGLRRRVGAAEASELSPLAATLYPPLPSHPLRLRDLLGFAIRQSRGGYGRLVLAIAALGALSWVTPLITQAIVSSIIPRTELDQLAFCVLALVVTAVASAGVQLVEMTVMLRIEGLIDWKLQAAVFDRVLRLPAAIFRDFTVGDFVDRTLGIDSVRRVLTGRTLRGLLSGLLCGFSLALMIYYDGKLALVAMGLIGFRAVVIVATSGLRLYHEARYLALHGTVSGLVLQLLAGVGKLRIAAATQRGLAVWGVLYAAQKRQFVAARRFANALTVFEGSFAVLATLAIFAASVYLESSLQRDLGAFLGFFAAFGQAMASVGSWAAGVSDALGAIPHLTRIRPLIAANVEISEDRKPPGTLSGAIELSRVTFRYAPSGPPVLDNLTLRIAAGEYVALVGPSGSGKSSLFRLLLGFERAEAGAIFYDGKAIDTLDVGALRRQFGVVLQNGGLTNGSIYDNICGGAPLPLDQVREAARLASLEDDLAAMPMGLHTLVSEGVSTISGGQRQRIMIARAIARRPRIILLDEATSSLDNRSQAVVTAALGNLNVTRIVIAHRLSTVREADRIIVLADGKVVQSGSFEALSRTAGPFADLARRQML